MNEYIKSAELCRRCKYSTKGAICDAEVVTEKLRVALSNKGVVQK